MAAQQWEYAIWSSNIADLEAAGRQLKMAGEDGWELVSVVLASPGVAVYYAKRRAT